MRVLLKKSLSTDAAANDFPFVNIYSRDSVGRAISFSISGVVPSWITCEIHENGVSVPAEIGVRLDENPTHANRSATITLVQSHSGKTLTIKVSQSGRFYNLQLLGSGVVYLWDNGLKPNDAISPTTKFTTNCPNLEVAKRVADEAQRLIDIYGYYNFLNLVEFMKQNPSMVQMGLSLINKNNAVWKK